MKNDLLVLVGRTPWSARDALVPLPGQYRLLAEREEADQGVRRGPGGPPHHGVAGFTGSATVAAFTGVAGVAASAALTGLTADRSLA